MAHDELWHVYGGSPLTLVTYDGCALGTLTIGPGCRDRMAVIPGGVFQAARSTGTYTLAGCTVAPGFEFRDFSFLSDDPALSESLRRNHGDLVPFL